jgi:hypothetical protein
MLMKKKYILNLPGDLGVFYPIAAAITAPL